MLPIQFVAILRLSPSIWRREIAETAEEIRTRTEVIRYTVGTTEVVDMYHPQINLYEDDHINDILNYLYNGDLVLPVIFLRIPEQLVSSREFQM